MGRSEPDPLDKPKSVALKFPKIKFSSDYGLIIIAIYFENVHYYHAKLWVDDCPIKGKPHVIEIIKDWNLFIEVFVLKGQTFSSKSLYWKDKPFHQSLCIERTKPFHQSLCIENDEPFYQSLFIEKTNFFKVFVLKGQTFSSKSLYWRTTLLILLKSIQCKFCCLCWQSSRHVIHLVLEPAQVHSIHSLAQLSLGHTQDHHLPASRRSHRPILLQPARVHGQKDARSLRICG